MRVPYKSNVRKPKKSVFGRIMYWLSHHPIRTAIVMSLLTIVALAYPLMNVILKSPKMFGLIVLAIILGWVILMVSIKPILRILGVREVEVSRYVEFSGGTFRWHQNDRELGRINNPRFFLYAKPVPENILTSNTEQSWPVWLVVRPRGNRSAQSSTDDMFIAKTDVTALEASHYDHVTPDIRQNTDENLDPGQAQPLLNLAERARHG